jgi:hypothetical protein
MATVSPQLPRESASSTGTIPVPWLKRLGRGADEISSALCFEARSASRMGSIATGEAAPACGSLGKHD